MKQVARIWLTAALALGIVGCGAQTEENPREDESTQQTEPTPQAGLSADLQQEADAAIEKGLNTLAENQNDGGFWSQKQFPAVTALATWGMLNSGNPEYAEHTDKALAYIKSCIQPDGGIYQKVPGRKGGGLSNYNTAICMTVLHASGRDEFVPAVLKARRFIADAQHVGDDIYKGGFGYDRETKRAYTDLMNTMYSMEAMRRTQDVEDKRPEGEARADIDWDSALTYVDQLQNKEDSSPEDEGGFVYNTDDPKAGVTTNTTGKVVFRSYGSMTYVGLLSLIYADVDRDDPRVQSAADWASRHWTLEENPGMGQQGLYYFFNVLSKALNTAGQSILKNPENQAAIDWRHQVIARIIALQKEDGSWVNESARYWENDPSLVTAYSVLALQQALGETK